MFESTREYGEGTSLTQYSPWGTFLSARVMCSDGKVRKVRKIAQTADTFFSVPCSVKVRGREVSGYLTVETAQGYSTEMPDDLKVVKFVANTYGKNSKLLPEGKWKP